MTCKNAKDKISVYLDGDLPLNEVQALKDHIESCKECHELFEDMKLMKEIMSDIPQLELPEGFEAELHEKLVEAASEMDTVVSFESEKQKQERGKTSAADDRKVVRIPLPSWKDFRRHSRPLTAVAATVLIAFLAYGAGSVMDYMPQKMEEAVYDDYAYETTESATAEEAAPEIQFNATRGDGNVVGITSYTLSDDEAKLTAKSADSPAMFGATMDAASMDMADNLVIEGVDANASADVSVTMAESDEPTEESVVESTVDSRMIIYSADVWLDIVNYDETYEKIAAMVRDMGGYISDANTSYKYYDESNPDNSLKYGRLTIRVPQERFMGTVDFLETMGVQKNLNIWSQDITAQYRDIANEVVNLEIRETKLREIMERAEEVEDVITVERELSRVRGDINTYMGTLKDWERLVSLSTIHIDLNEVETLEPKIKPLDKTLLQKARDGFVNSINQLKFLGETLFIGLIAFSPKILVWAIVFFVGYKIVKWLLRKSKK